MTVEEASAAINQGFAGAKATAAKHVWEQMPGGWKFIVSVHGILAGGLPVIHTKFIVWADETRQTLKKNVCTYLYDLNCVFRTFEFSDAADLTKRVASLVAAGQFGPRLKGLSAELLDGMPSINEALVKDGTKGLTVLSMDYVPRYEIAPCAETAFDFKLSVSPDHPVALTVSYDASKNEWTSAIAVSDAKDKTVVGNPDELAFALAKQLKKLLQRT